MPAVPYLGQLRASLVLYSVTFLHDFLLEGYLVGPYHHKEALALILLYLVATSPVGGMSVKKEIRSIGSAGFTDI